MGYTGTSKKSLNDPPCKRRIKLPSRLISTPLLTLVRVPAGNLHTRNIGQGTCISVTPVMLPAGYLHIRDTGQIVACRVPAPLLTPVRISAGYLHTHDTGQITYRVPASLLIPVRISAGYLHTHDTGQDTNKVEQSMNHLGLGTSPSSHTSGTHPSRTPLTDVISDNISLSLSDNPSLSLSCVPLPNIWTDLSTRAAATQCLEVHCVPSSP